MDRSTRYCQIPYFNLIRENETITIPSIFVFKGGCCDIFSFRQACKEYNCTVIFENENLIMCPDGGGAHYSMLVMYGIVAENPKLAEDYIHYLSMLMKDGGKDAEWVKGQHDPILTVEQFSC